MPEDKLGPVMELVGARRGQLVEMTAHEDYTYTIFSIPARGLIGLRTRLLNATQGTAIVHHRFESYRPMEDEIPGRPTGVLVSMTAGRAVAFGLDIFGAAFVYQLIQKLEEVANSYDGVAKAFALQAGREIRIIVESQKISDDKAVLAAKEIAQKIKDELDYPGQIEVTVPSLLAYELANVLRYKADLSTEQVQAAMGSLFDMQVTWMLPSAGVMEQAVEIARTHETTVYDATFVALAGTLEAAFITADERLARQLEAFPFVRFLGESDLQGELD